MEQRSSSSRAHQGHRLWASMPVAFWVYFYKVQRCPLSGAHNWKECPYWHRGERDRRRDPRSHSYLSEPCPDYFASFKYHKMHSTGGVPTCVRGLTCRYAHGDFEAWMHQDRFRTRMCKAGLGCERPICFFAHSSSEHRRAGDRVPFVDLRLLMPSGPQRPVSPPPARPAARPVLALPAPPPSPQRDVMMLQTRSGMRRISLREEADASSFSRSSSSSSGSSSSSSSAASSSSSPPDVVIAATAITSPALMGHVAEDDAAATVSPAPSYPVDNKVDNGMSDDDEDSLGEFPYFDIIKDFVLG
ncbi:hypothetical protein EJB05_10655, partial [Eragrostis curvula]